MTFWIFRNKKERLWAPQFLRKICSLGFIFQITQVRDTGPDYLRLITFTPGR